MFGADVLVPEAFRLFGCHIEDALALRAQRHFDGGGNSLADGDARLNFFPDGLDRTLLAQEAVGQRLVLAHQAEKQVFGLDVRASVLAGFVPGKKNDATRFLCVSFEHVSSLLPLGYPSPRLSPSESAEHHVQVPRSGHSAPPAPDCASRSATRGDACDAAAPSTRTQPKHSARPDPRS